MSLLNLPPLEELDPIPVRRSQRIKNKYNPDHGTRLHGDKQFLFSNQHSLTKPIRRCSRKLQLVRHAPNIFTIDNFLTEKEVDHLLTITKDHVENEQFEESYTQATAADQIYSKERTSTFIFLQKYMDKFSRAIEARAAGIVSIPIENVEPLQIVRYTEGQEFTLHHDAGTLINESELQRMKRGNHLSLQSNCSSVSNTSDSSNHSDHSGNSFGATNSVDYIHHPVYLQKIKENALNTTNTSNTTNTNNPNISTIPQLPQQLCSAQYATYYQKWQENLQEIRENDRMIQIQHPLLPLPNITKLSAVDMDTVTTSNTTNTTNTMDIDHDQSDEIMCSSNSDFVSPIPNDQRMNGMNPTNRCSQSCPPPSIPSLSMHSRSNLLNPMTASNGDEYDELTTAKCAEVYDEYTVDIVAPVRICSFFVYLTTMPENCGGETYFPKVELKVRPERGKAILWCNVDPENTLKADPMTIHRACPVKGNHEKIGMNIWIDAEKVDGSYR